MGAAKEGGPDQYCNIFHKGLDMRSEEIRKDLQTIGVMVHRVLSKLPVRFKHLVHQIWSKEIMLTLKELHARLQMEENFQIGKRSLNCSDPKEALVM